MSYLLASVRSSFLQAVQTLSKKGSRRLLNLRMRNASLEERVVAERRMRGREQFRKLQRSDVAVVSFGKSGRTWLRVMVSRLYQLRHGLPERALIGFDNFHNMNRAIPRLFFTHDNYIGDFTGNLDSKADFYDKKVVLLVRDPRDVAVSQFFQWKFRMKPEKKSLNQYPAHGREVEIYDFLMDEDAGLLKVVRFMNLWAKELPNLKQAFLLRYEDLKAAPEQTLERLAAFLDVGASPEQIRDAVDFASYDNMKKMEASNTFLLSGGRMAPRDRSNPDSYKVRKAKVGGYRDYLDAEQIAAIDQLLAETLSPMYGYGGSTEVQQSPAT